MKRVLFHILLYLMQVAPLLASEEQVAINHGPWCQKDIQSMKFAIANLGDGEVCSFNQNFDTLGLTLPRQEKETREYCFVPMHFDYCQKKYEISGNVQCLSAKDYKRRWKVDLKNKSPGHPTNFLAAVPQISFQHRCGEHGLASRECLGYLENHGSFLADIFQIKPLVNHHFVLWDGMGFAPIDIDSIKANMNELKSFLTEGAGPFHASCTSVYIGHSKGIRKILSWVESESLSSLWPVDKIKIQNSTQSVSHLGTLKLALEKVQEDFKIREPAVNRSEFLLHQDLTFLLAQLPIKTGKLYELRSLEKLINEMQKRTDFSFLVAYRPEVLTIQSKKIIPRSIKGGLFSWSEDSSVTPPIELPDEYMAYKSWLKSIISYDPFKIELSGDFPWKKDWHLLGERYPQLLPPKDNLSIPIFIDTVPSIVEKDFNPLRTLAVEDPKSDSEKEVKGSSPSPGF